MIWCTTDRFSAAPLSALYACCMYHNTVFSHLLYYASDLCSFGAFLGCASSVPHSLFRQFRNPWLSVNRIIVPHDAARWADLCLRHSCVPRGQGLQKKDLHDLSVWKFAPGRMHSPRCLTVGDRWPGRKRSPASAIYITIRMWNDARSLFRSFVHLDSCVEAIWRVFNFGHACAAPQDTTPVLY